MKRGREVKTCDHSLYVVPVDGKTELRCHLCEFRSEDLVGRPWTPLFPWLGLEPPAPNPITCCGQWEWNGQDWINTDTLNWLDPTFPLTLSVCRKCHRGLLEDGKMTGSLVDRRQVIRGVNVPQARMVSIETILDVASLNTWGPSDE